MKKSVFSRRVDWLTTLLGLLVGPLAPNFAAAALPLKAAPVTLAWNSANDPSVQGYGIYYGPTNQPTTNYVDASTNLSVTLFDLVANMGYWFYAVAYDAAGNQSVPSNSLMFTAPPPVCPRLGIERLATGEFRLALFAAPGSVFQFEYADQPSGGPWEILGLGIPDANGGLAVIDLATSHPAARFYRAAWLANPPPFTRQSLAPPAKRNLPIKLNDSPNTTSGKAVATNLRPNPGTLKSYRSPL